MSLSFLDMWPDDLDVDNSFLPQEPEGDQDPVPPPTMPEKKRRRPPLSCEQCRKRKIRCDRTQPCQNCLRANIPSCTYAPAHVPAWRNKITDSAGSAVGRASSTVDNSSRVSKRVLRPAIAASAEVPTSESELGLSATTQPATASPFAVTSGTGSSTDASPNVDWLLARVHQLEDTLAKVMSLKDSEATKKSEAPTELVEHASGLMGDSRYIPQGHWFHGISLFPVEFGIIHRDELGHGKLYTSLVRCKALGRKIKKNRLQPLSSANLGNQVPERELADKLVETYIRTFEGVFRVIHIPTFREEYERYWEQPRASNESFVILLQVILALGALLHDSVFSLRQRATQWIYEAQLWLMLPPEKKRANFIGLQIMCLLLLAKSACNVGTDMTWIMAGTLVRKAMHLGFHRDPKYLSNMTQYRAELRRRLWATVLELNMQFSFEAGGSPLLSPAQYDTQPPANLNDDELSDKNDGNSAESKALDVPTQTSVQRMLLSTVILRMNILNHTNGTRPGDAYEETLRLNSDLTKACRALTEALTHFQKKPNSPVTSFHKSVAEMFLYRCFHSLHQPIIVKYLNDARFYFSRKMCLDSALMITHIWGFPDAWPTTERSYSIMDRDVKHVVTNGVGMFRNIASQALIVIQAELLQQQSGQATGLGYLPSVGGGDLRARLEAALAWNLERARSGETNTKGIILIAACLTHIDALEQGLDPKDKVVKMFQRATDVSKQCLEILKEVAAREGLSPLEWEDEPVDMNAVSAFSVDWMQGWGLDDMQGITFPQWEPDMMDNDEFTDDLGFATEAL